MSEGNELNREEAKVFENLWEPNNFFKNTFIPFYKVSQKKVWLSFFLAQFLKKLGKLCANFFKTDHAFASSLLLMPFRARQTLIALFVDTL